MGLLTDYTTANILLEAEELINFLLNPLFNRQIQELSLG